MPTPYLLADIKTDEGLRLHAYPDPLTHAEPWTIGYGHTGPDVGPDTVWTQDQADEELAADVAHVQHGLDADLPWWRTLNDARQDVLVNMAFNMGVAGLLQFKHALADMQLGQFASAGNDMLNSEWAHQVHGRATRLATQMATGVRA